MLCWICPFSFFHGWSFCMTFCSWWPHESDNSDVCCFRSPARKCPLGWWFLAPRLCQVGLTHDFCQHWVRHVVHLKLKQQVNFYTAVQVWWWFRAGPPRLEWCEEVDLILSLRLSNFPSSIIMFYVLYLFKHLNVAYFKCSENFFCV